MKIRKSLFSILLAGVLSALFTSSAFAQLRSYTQSYNKNNEKNKYYFKGLTLSYNYTTPFKVSIKHYFSGFNGSGNLVPERDNFQTINAKPVNFGSLTTYFPMVYTSDKSMFALDLGYEGMGYVGTVYNVTADDNFNFEADFAQANVGLHVGLSYKHGGLASYAKQDKFSWFAGAGLVPSLSMMNYGDIVKHTKFSVVPVFNAGIGLFAGIQWTIIGKYYPIGFGNEFILGSNLRGMDYFPSSTRISIKTESFFQLGIGLNLFSLKWDEYRW